MSPKLSVKKEDFIFFIYKDKLNSISVNVSWLANCQLHSFVFLAVINCKYKLHWIFNKTEDSVPSFHPLCQLRRTSGITAATAVQVPGPVQVLDQDLVHAPAAEAETTSSKALPRYRYICVCLSLRPHSDLILISVLSGQITSTGLNAPKTHWRPHLVTFFQQS